MKKRRLFIVFGNLGLGGIQTKLIPLTRQLLQEKAVSWDIHLVVRDKGLFSHADSFPKHITIHYRPSWGSGKFHVPFSAYLLWMAVWYRPQGILTFLNVLSVFAVGISKIVFWRHIRVVLNEDTYPSFHTRRRVLRACMRIFYPDAQCVIVPTHAAADDLAASFGVPREKIRVIPNWTPVPAPDKRYRKPYDLLYTGRFEPQKNLRRLVRVVQALAKNHPAVRLCLTGEGSEKAALLHEALTRGVRKNITILPPTDDTRALYTQTKIFVLYSQYEGMPLSLLEAMAHGLPSVVMRYPGVEECIVHGKTGFITDSETEYVACVERLLAAPRKAGGMGSAARRDARKRFWKKPLRMFIDTLTEAIP